MPFPEYAAHGGGFPVWLQNAPAAPIAVIVVSGLPQRDDHMSECQDYIHSSSLNSAMYSHCGNAQGLHPQDARSHSTISCVGQRDLYSLYCTLSQLNITSLPTLQVVACRRYAPSVLVVGSAGSSSSTSNAPATIISKVRGEDDLYSQTRACQSPLPVATKLLTGLVSIDITGTE